MAYYHIVIEGNIGAGKTSLVQNFSERSDVFPVYERFAENPYLSDFYKNPDPYAFPLEMFFLAERYQQLRECVAHPDLFHSLVVADHFIGRSRIFAAQNLRADEWRFFKAAYERMEAALPAPDLLVYLRSPVAQLMKNIAERGRSFEGHISEAYLRAIENGYRDFLETPRSYPVVFLETVEAGRTKSTAELARELQALLDARSPERTCF